jgi:hypothetical protein
MNHRGSILRNPSVFIGSLAQVRLNPELQIAPIVSIKRNETKRLLGARQRAQHFCLREHRTSVSEEHQANPGVGIEGSRQTEHAACPGNNLQTACHAASVLASKNCRGGVRKMHSCSASGREDWGEGCHTRQVCYAIKTNRKITEVPDPSQSDACCAEPRPKGFWFVLAETLEQHSSRVSRSRSRSDRGRRNGNQSAQ